MTSGSEPVGTQGGPSRRQGLPRGLRPAEANGETTAPEALPVVDKPSGRRPGRLLVWLALAVGSFAVVTAAVGCARWLVSTPGVAEFLVRYPGEYALPNFAPVGIPPWLAWQHFFNVFFMALIVRTGITVRRQKRPAVYWASRRQPTRKISLTLWLHQSLDLLWVVNGLLYVTLLFATGQWVRIVPSSWAVFPNALSAGLQYLSLHWPVEDGWVNYNSLQQLAYFTTVFVAAPLAVVSGVRMSGLWPTGSRKLDRLFPLAVARAIHFPVMIYFCVFVVMHVSLVLATGALRNTNNMFAARQSAIATGDWTGLLIFALSLFVIVGGLFAVRTTLLSPVARLFGQVTRR